jgi:hypothetical protein
MRVEQTQHKPCMFYVPFVCYSSFLLCSANVCQLAVHCGQICCLKPPTKDRSAASSLSTCIQETCNPPFHIKPAIIRAQSKETAVVALVITHEYSLSWCLQRLVALHNVWPCSVTCHRRGECKHTYLFSESQYNTHGTA